MMLKLVYILQHLLFVLLLNNKTKKLLFYIVITTCLFIYLLKPDTFDIISYTEAMNYPFIFEVGYAFLSYWVHHFIQDPRVSLYIVQIILALLFISLYKKTGTGLIGIAIIVSSVAFSLGVNNDIRQAYASIFLIYSLLLFFEKKHIYSIILVFLAMTFHKSSILFYIFSIYGYLNYILYLRVKINNRSISFSIYLLSSFFIIFLGIFFLWFLLNNGFYKGYKEMNMTVDSGRTLLSIKVFSISVVFLMSELFTKINYKNLNYLNFFRVLRISFLILLFYLSFRQGFNELGSRVMYFYYIIEMMLLLYLFKYNQKKAVVSILFFYGFALNVLNIIGGVS
jgi:hypothetical protein